MRIDNQGRRAPADELASQLEQDQVIPVPVMFDAQKRALPFEPDVAAAEADAKFSKR